MRQYRIDQIEICEERLAELHDLRDDLQGQIDEIEVEMDGLMQDIEDHNEHLYEDGSELDEWREDDDRQRAADMNATLRDIGGTWI